MKGPGWWLLWSAFESIGFFIIILRRNPAYEQFAIATQDIFLMLGVTFLCIGILKFFEISVHRAYVIAGVIAFSLIHWFFQYVYDDIIIRSLLFSITIVFISFSIVFHLIKKYWRNLEPAVIFNTVIMAFHGCVFIYRTIVILLERPQFNLFIMNFSNLLQFFDALIVSILWTYGFIMMLNEKLNRDITEAKEHFENIFETSPDAIAITRLSDGVYVASNDGFEGISGYSKNELIGKSAFELNIWKDISDRAEILQQVIEAGSCENYETRFNNKNGSEITGLLSAKLITLHGEPHLLSITRDISDRKKTEDALRESEQRLQFVLEGSQLGLWDWNVVSGEVKRNARWAEMLGYAFDEIDFSVHQWTDLILQDDRKTVAASMDNHMNGRTPMYRTEYRMRCKDGSYKWILDQAKVVSRDANGKPLRMSGTHTDITEQKRIHEELSLKNQELQKINSERNRFFSIIAHDLKSPFLGFMGLTNLMAEEAGEFTADELTKFGRELNLTAQNMYKLLKNLLEWAQMQQGTLDYQPKDLSLSEHIQSTIEVLRERSEQKGIKIITEIEKPYIVYADERMTDSILLNLISNAVKFTHRFGKVTIVAQPSSDRMIEVTISDTGIGMTKQDIDKLFKVGEKVRTLGTDGELSTGLGLLLCKEFVEKHGAGYGWRVKKERAVCSGLLCRALAYIRHKIF
jgi:PAS domain S-box-containing protein